MTTPAEKLKQKILNNPHVAVSMLTDTPADKQVVQIRLDTLLELFTSQQQALLDEVEKEVVGDDARIDIPGASITNTAHRHENELRAEQRKALQRIKGELGEGAV